MFTRRGEQHRFCANAFRTVDNTPAVTFARQSFQTTRLMATNYTLRRKQADRLRLYELSVQDPQFEVELAARKYRQRNGRPARVLREDFCGSAAVACQWVSDHEDNRAIGLDLDQPTLDWATQHNVARLGSAAERVDLRCQDVRNATRPYADIAQGLNFSSYLMYPRSTLLSYLESVRHSLSPGGIIMLDGYGGWESGQKARDRRIVDSPDGTFGYIWEQGSFNPIDNLAHCHIHFVFKNQKRWKRAFSYHWRVYTPAELTDALEETGFRNVEVLWDVDDDPESSDFRPMTEVKNCPGWLFYIVAER